MIFFILEARIYTKISCVPWCTLKILESIPNRRIILFTSFLKIQDPHLYQNCGKYNLLGDKSSLFKTSLVPSASWSENCFCVDTSIILMAQVLICLSLTLLISLALVLLLASPCFISPVREDSHDFQYWVVYRFYHMMFVYNCLNWTLHDEVMWLKCYWEQHF